MPIDEIAMLVAADAYNKCAERYGAPKAHCAAFPESLKAYETAKAAPTEQPDENTLVEQVAADIWDARHRIQWVYLDEAYGEAAGIRKTKYRKVAKAAIDSLRPFLRQPEREAVTLELKTELIGIIEQNLGERPLTSF